MRTTVLPSNPLYPALIEHALDLITVLDERGTITFHSPSVQRLLGYSPLELLGCCAFDYVHPDDLPRVHAEFTRAWTTGQASPFVEFRFRHKDGEWRALESIGSVFSTADGARVGIVNSRDITQHRSLQDQLRRTQQIATLGRFTTTIVHEFRNALQVILGNLDFILESQTAPAILQPELQGIRRAGKIAEVLTHQLLEFSRESPSSIALIEVNRSVMSLSATLQHLVGREIKVQTAIQAEDDVVLARAGVLDQILLNLAGNARDAIAGRGTLTIATRNGQLETRDELAVPLDNECVVIDVTDSGEGMSREVQARLFEPFFTTKQDGTGLGLSTVRAMVEEAGGRLDVRSERGHGTTFSIYWPLACVMETCNGSRVQ